MSPALAGGFFITEPSGKSFKCLTGDLISKQNKIFNMTSFYICKSHDFLLKKNML